MKRTHPIKRRKPSRPQHPIVLSASSLEVGPPDMGTPTFAIVPTIYPEDPSKSIIVHNHITININGEAFREFSAKMEEMLIKLRRSNAIAREVRNKLIGEMNAGEAILSSPKPDPTLLKMLLVRTLRYIAEKAAGAAIGKLAAAALDALAKLAAGLF